MSHPEAPETVQPVPPGTGAQPGTDAEPGVIVHVPLDNPPAGGAAEVPTVHPDDAAEESAADLPAPRIAPDSAT